MKKSALRVSLGTALLVAGIALFASCSTLKHVSASRFLELTEQIPLVETIRDTSFIGSTESRVYLQHWQKVPFMPEIIVYWTYVSDLPEELASELRSGRNPWPDPFSQASEPMQADGPAGRR